MSVEVEINEYVPDDKSIGNESVNNNEVIVVLWLNNCSTKN